LIYIDKNQKLWLGEKSKVQKIYAAMHKHLARKVHLRVRITWDREEVEEYKD
jgi:hypothetical protein